MPPKSPMPKHTTTHSFLHTSHLSAHSKKTEGTCPCMLQVYTNGMKQIMEKDTKIMTVSTMDAWLLSSMHSTIYDGALNVHHSYQQTVNVVTNNKLMHALKYILYNGIPKSSANAARRKCTKIYLLLPLVCTFNETQTNMEKRLTGSVQLSRHHPHCHIWTLIM